MTTQTAINAQAFGTSTNVGNGKFSISPLTLAATTTAFVVCVKVDLGDSQPKSQTTKLRVWYTTCYESVAAGVAVAQLQQTAHYVDVVLNDDILRVDSELEPITGGFFNCWVDAPNQAVAGALTVTLIELP